MYLYFFRFFRLRGKGTKKGWKPLNLFVLPGCFFQIKGAGYQQTGIIDHLGGEADGYRHMEPHAHYVYVKSVKNQGCHLDEQGRAGIARTGNAAECHIAYRADQHSAGNNVDRGDRSGDQGRIVGVNRQDGAGEKDNEGYAYGHDVER